MCIQMADGPRLNPSGMRRSRLLGQVEVSLLPCLRPAFGGRLQRLEFGVIMGRDAVFNLRLTPSELDRIRAVAEARQTKVSVLIRDGLAAVVNSKPVLTPKDVTALAELRDEVRRVGVNLNALLRSVHLEEHGVRDNGPRLADYQALAKDLRAALDRLTSATRALPL